MIITTSLRIVELKEVCFLVCNFNPVCFNDYLIRSDSKKCVKLHSASFLSPKILQAIELFLSKVEISHCNISCNNTYKKFGAQVFLSDSLQKVLLNLGVYGRAQGVRE